jgi:hypothetical protein
MSFSYVQEDDLYGFYTVANPGSPATRYNINGTTFEVPAGFIVRSRRIVANNNMSGDTRPLVRADDGDLIPLLDWIATLSGTFLIVNNGTNVSGTNI